MAASSSSSSYPYHPCAACKYLRKKCVPDCIFAPYFLPDELTKFANVHKIFGASNVSKLLNEILPNKREDAVKSLAYEAEARLRDPVYGCVGTIFMLERQVRQLQKELDAINAHRMRCTRNDTNTTGLYPAAAHGALHDQQRVAGYGSGGSFDPNKGYSGPFYYGEGK